jgi:hypothetical protein
MKAKRIFIFVLGITLVLIVLSAIPIEKQAVPEWRIQIVDEFGVKVSGVDAEEEWVEFGQESHTMVDIRHTDSNGWVTFPARSPRASIFYRLLISSLGISGAELTAPAAHVFVCWDNRVGDVDWVPIQGSPPARLVLKPGGCPYG